MLVLFKFSNFGPFKEEACLDMRAVKAYKEHPYNLIDPDGANPCLKVASTYGANASGKSNFIEAYYTFRKIVAESFSRNEKIHGVEGTSVLHENYKPHLFDKDTANKETEFEAVYVINDSEYRYGFSYNDEQIKYEWLYKKSLKTCRSSTLLERSPEAGIVLGASVKKTLEKYKAEIDDDVLALSFYGSLKLKTPVFGDVLKAITAFLPLFGSLDLNHGRILDIYSAAYDREADRQKLLVFLKAIDVGIQDIRFERNESTKKVEIYTFHTGSNGALQKVPLSIESDGTRRAIAIYALFMMALEMDAGIFFDELNIQLHPLLMKYLIDLFTKESRHAQLIYTTHDTTLLNKRYLRRDQIWFISKDENGQSALYSLADFKIRNDESFEKEYLGGVFGAIPDLKDYSFEEGSHGAG